MGGIECWALIFLRQAAFAAVQALHALAAAHDLIFNCASAYLDVAMTLLAQSAFLAAFTLGTEVPHLQLHTFNSNFNCNLKFNFMTLLHTVNFMTLLHATTSN